MGRPVSALGLLGDCDKPVLFFPITASPSRSRGSLSVSPFWGASRSHTVTMCCKTGMLVENQQECDQVVNKSDVITDAKQA